LDLFNVCYAHTEWQLRNFSERLRTAAAFRIGDAVEYFLRNGNDIRVITAHAHKAIVNSKNSENEFLKNVSIYRSKTISIGLGGLWR
jgi:hypothetical protein